MRRACGSPGLALGFRPLALFSFPEKGVGEEAELVGVGERVELWFCEGQAFAGSEDPVVDSAGSGQVESLVAAGEKFRVAPCRSVSIRLLSLQVQFDRRARSPAVSPAASISSKRESAYRHQSSGEFEVGVWLVKVTCGSVFNDSTMARTATRW